MSLIRLDAPPLPIIPHAQTRIQHPRQHEPAIRTEPHARHGRRVLVEERPQALPRRRVPHTNQPVGGARSDERAVAVEVHAAHGIRVRGERAHQARRAHIPEVHGFVVRARDKHVAGGGEGQAEDVVVVAEKGARVRFACADVPQADGFVVGARGEGVRVW